MIVNFDGKLGNFVYSVQRAEIHLQSVYTKSIKINKNQLLTQDKMSWWLIWYNGMKARWKVEWYQYGTVEADWEVPWRKATHHSHQMVSLQLIRENFLQMRVFVP